MQPDHCDVLYLFLHRLGCFLALPFLFAPMGCATSGMMVPMDSQNLPDQPVTRVCGWVWIMRYHQLSSIRTIIPWTILFVSPENGRFHTTFWLCCLSQSRMVFRVISKFLVVDWLHFFGHLAKISDSWWMSHCWSSYPLVDLLFVGKCH